MDEHGIHIKKLRSPHRRELAVAIFCLLSDHDELRKFFFRIKKRGGVSESESFQSESSSRGGGPSLSEPFSRAGGPSLPEPTPESFLTKSTSCFKGTAGTRVSSDIVLHPEEEFAFLQESWEKCTFVRGAHDTWPLRWIVPANCKSLYVLGNRS